jgi:hypothetical protein
MDLQSPMPTPTIHPRGPFTPGTTLNIANMPTGKRPKRTDLLGRTLRLSKYTAALAPPPITADWLSIIKSYPMDGNDILGDCCEAAMAHIEQWWSASAGRPWTPTLQQVIAAYSAIGGYIPGQPNTDNGSDMLTMLNYWRQTGLDGHKIYAFLALDPAKPVEFMQSIVLFGGAIIGIQLPVSAQTPIVGLNGYPAWIKPPNMHGDNAPGGHCTPTGQYGVDAKGNKGIEIVTWGQLYDVTWAYLAAYADECYVAISYDWIEANGKSPSGFDLAQLEADLRLVTA